MQNDRDIAICLEYESGKTVAEIADAFALSRERVYQILKEAKIWKPEQDRRTASGPHEVIASYVPTDVKIRLKMEADRQGKTVSQLTCEQITNFLREQGYKL